VIIGVDVDEVVAELHAPWVRWCNEVYGTNIVNFHRWEIHEEYPEIGMDVYKFIRPWIYEGTTVKPIRGALEAVEKIRAKGHDIAYVTSCLNDTEVAKNRWLERNGFLQRGDAYIPARDKSDVPVDILVDDAVHNVDAFEGLAILVHRCHNRLAKYPLSVDNLLQFSELL
jgi:5'(3')-deoxyribonucleotidase